MCSINVCWFPLMCSAYIQRALYKDNIRRNVKYSFYSHSIGNSRNLFEFFSLLFLFCHNFTNIDIVLLFIDVCKDSSDDDFSDDSGSSKTEGYAVLDLEYELASSSDDSDTLSSVSSGTDVSSKMKNGN
jgi:hypothetical protein